MTKRECAIITAHTGINMLEGEDLKYLYDYISQLLGWSVMTHEILLYMDLIKAKSYSDFIELCRTATEK